MWVSAIDYVHSPSVWTHNLLRIIRHPTWVFFYCCYQPRYFFIVLGFQLLQTCYITTEEGWQHVIFCTPCRFVTGINHLIAFEANLLIVSRNHSTFACRSFLSSRRRSRFFRILTLSFSLVQPRLFAKTFSPFFCILFARKKGDTEIRTLDPWSDKLLRWQLDHATPLS